MTEVTRKVDARDLEVLLSQATIATAAWNENGQPAAAPVAFSYDDGTYRVGWPAGTAPGTVFVSLLIDAGAHYFDLRGVRIRGPHSRLHVVGATDLEWTVVAPERVTAWHYGTMRPR